MVFKYCSAWRLSWKLKVYIPPSNHNPPPHFSEYSRICKSNIWYVDYSKATMTPPPQPITWPILTLSHVEKGRNHSLSIKGVQESRKNLGLSLDFETNTSLGLSLDLEIWQKKVSIPVSISRFYKKSLDPSLDLEILQIKSRSQSRRWDYKKKVSVSVSKLRLNWS